LRNLWRTVSRGRDPVVDQGKSPHPEEEGAAETACNEMIVTPIPCPPALLRGRKREKRE